MKILNIEDAIHHAPIQRRIGKIMLHTTGTLPTAAPGAILKYWKEVMKWTNPGYHIMIGTDKEYYLQPFEIPSNGARGHNFNTIHISYIGGLLKSTDNLPHETNEHGYYFVDTRNAYQWDRTVFWVRRIWELTAHQSSRPVLLGHNQVSNKACPIFDVQEWRKMVGL